MGITLAFRVFIAGKEGALGVGTDKSGSHTGPVSIAALPIATAISFRAFLLEGLWRGQ